MTQTIIKIFLLSTLISFFIKYGARILSLQPNTLNALIAIITPTLIMIVLLVWRLKKVHV